jgi:multidrug resistance efflux pump
MTYTEADLLELKKALKHSERRVSFGDRSVEYRSIEELKVAIREVEADLARSAGKAKTRQIRATTRKGF